MSSKETQIAQAAFKMKLAYIDWMDNYSDEHFKDLFFDAQEHYKELTK